jgi:hypothetical protein
MTVMPESQMPDGGVHPTTLAQLDAKQVRSGVAWAVPAA